MAFDDRFRMSCHAVITDAAGQVLLLQASYGDGSWGLPGGALEPGETIHQALLRECREELGVTVGIDYLSGIYYHAQYQSQVCIFRCQLPAAARLQLSGEHLAWRYWALVELSAVQRRRVEDCLGFDGTVRSAAF
ncbi:NUDIX hydrolase [Vogesella sp. LIG4]|uniref:NUDIX hydrolase n=1 Tax=Vogesella sp. LIG4 TaxID=1192162 RepID=UPI0008200795|nr:NUDIX domain-containing protein [Vogesella sp. LIG4]SCK18079.1 NTP pyrophosphohydrolases including oxidative damage repair enzymes [Vogesella sp. LIG4]